MKQKRIKLYIYIFLILILFYQILTEKLIMYIESNALVPQKFNNLDKLEKKYNRIVLGDSRSHQAIDPKILDYNSDYVTYNLASPGMQIPFMYYVSKKYIDLYGAPKQIIVNMSFYLLGGNQWMKDIYFQHYKPSIQEALDSYVNKLNYNFKDAINWYLTTHIPSIKYEARINKLLSDVKSFPDIYKESFKARQILFDENYQGYMPRGYGHIQEKISTVNYTKTLHNGYSVYFDYLERFFELTNRYDTKIFIYDFPWPEAYSDNSNLKEAIIFYNDLIKKVVDKFPNVYFLENNNLFLSHENFIDPLHVNNLGAEIISRQLSYELNKR